MVAIGPGLHFTYLVRHECGLKKCSKGGKAGKKQFGARPRAAELLFLGSASRSVLFIRLYSRTPMHA